jgi:hypothetical protein
MLLEKMRGGNYESGSTEAALLGIMLNERLHHGRKFVAFCQSLDGRDFRALSVDRQHRTCIDRLAVQQDRARTTGAAIADALGSSVIERPPKSIEQSHAGFELSAQLLAIYAECDWDFAGAMYGNFLTGGLDHLGSQDQRNRGSDGRDLHEVASRDSRSCFGLARVVVFHLASTMGKERSISVFRRWRELLVAESINRWVFIDRIAYRTNGPMNESITLRAEKQHGSDPLRAAAVLGAILLLLLQGANILHDVTDLGVRQLAFLRGHLALAVGDDGGHVGIGHLLHFRATERLESHALAHAGAGAAVGAMAHGTLRLEGVRARALGGGDGRNHQCQG